MSISRVQNPLTAAGLGSIGRPVTPSGAGNLGGTDGRSNATRATSATATPAAASPLGAPQRSLPAEAPAGTDPELWGVLTSEERTFFAKAVQSGPLTYGRMAAGVQALQGNAAAANAFAAASRGGRLDVRA
jgi:hypothetical protein